MASKWVICLRWLPAPNKGETLTHSLSTLSPKVSPKMHVFLNSMDPKEKPVGKLHAIPYIFFFIKQNSSLNFQFVPTTCYCVYNWRCFEKIKKMRKYFIKINLRYLCIYLETMSHTYIHRFLDRIDDEEVPHSSSDFFIPRSELCVGYLIRNVIMWYIKFM